MGQERVDKMVEGLRKWQGIERKAMEQTAAIIEKTTNPFVRTVMEVIRHDSLMHHRVQQTIVDSRTRESMALSPDDLLSVWNLIEEHDETEKEVIAIATELRDMAWSPLHKHLLTYLLHDEEKHDRLLEEMDELKKDATRSTQ